jgi:hypothetical protein
MKYLAKNGPRVRKIGCVITLLRVVFGIKSGGWLTLYIMGALHTKSTSMYPSFQVDHYRNFIG